MLVHENPVKMESFEQQKWFEFWEVGAKNLEFRPVPHGRVITSAKQLLNKCLPILGVSPLFKHHVETRDIEGEGIMVVVGKMWVLIFWFEKCGLSNFLTQNF